MFKYPLYHYNMEQFYDIGFGCSYRNIQTILSCKKYYQDSSIVVPHITTILSFFNPNYQEQIDKKKTKWLWIEPFQIHQYFQTCYQMKGENLIYILKDENLQNMLSTTIECYDIYTKDNFQELFQKIRVHFEISKLPVVIDDGYYSYCIGDINEKELYIIDPHQIDGSCIYTKPFSYLKNSFWMIYIPSE